MVTATSSAPLKSTLGGASFANGLTDNPLAATKWQTNDAVTYRFRVSVQDNNSAQGASTGTHSFTWEAQNQ